jgi:hypothetical protein
LRVLQEVRSALLDYEGYETIRLIAKVDERPEMMTITLPTNGNDVPLDHNMQQQQQQQPLWHHNLPYHHHNLAAADSSESTPTWSNTTSMSKQQSFSSCSPHDSGTYHHNRAAADSSESTPTWSNTTSMSKQQLFSSCSPHGGGTHHGPSTIHQTPKHVASFDRSIQASSFDRSTQASPTSIVAVDHQKIIKRAVRILKTKLVPVRSVSLSLIFPMWSYSAKQGHISLRTDR